jgi:hypothetical protein
MQGQRRQPEQLRQLAESMSTFGYEVRLEHEGHAASTCMLSLDQLGTGLIGSLGCHLQRHHPWQHHVSSPESCPF